MAAPILAYENLGLVQGSGWLFRELDIHVGTRDRLALIGRNGAGKTTTLLAVSNLLAGERGEVTKGQIHCRGERVDGLTPNDLVRRGVIQVWREGTASATSRSRRTF